MGRNRLQNSSNEPDDASNLDSGLSTEAAGQYADENETEHQRAEVD